MKFILYIKRKFLEGWYGKFRLERLEAIKKIPQLMGPFGLNYVIFDDDKLEMKKIYNRTIK